jgi:C-terminal processing protease CtpA/Prc
LRKDGEIKVHSVEPASPADVAGIRPKDRFVRLEGKPATEFRLAEIRRFLKSAVGTVVHLTIQREKRTIESQFRLKELSLLAPEPNRESPSVYEHR